MPVLKRTVVALLGTAMLVGAGGAAFADDRSENEEDAAELKASAGAKVTLVQAMNAAQSATGGSAIEAEFSSDAGQGAWEVELTQKDGSVKTVLVDPMSGAVDQNPQNTDDDDEEDENGEG